MTYSDHYKSDLIISYRHGKWYIDKDRNGPMGETNLAGVLRAIGDYQRDYEPIIKVWIEKLKIYSPFL